MTHGMLNQVLQEISKTDGPISLSVLSHKLGIERSALEGMMGYWVRKGRLKSADQSAEVAGGTCVSGSCGSSCPGASSCPFIAKMPRTYSVVIPTCVKISETFPGKQLG
jgi:hypothetical protein